MPDTHSIQAATSTAWPRWSRGLVLSLMLLSGALAAWADPVDDLLVKADNLKSVNYPQFVATLDDLNRYPQPLSPVQQQFLKYLRAWQIAYDADHATSLIMLRSIVAETTEPDLRFRALATIVNVLGISKRYEEAFKSLEDMLTLLPQVKDPAARQQGLGVAAYLYGQVGLTDLAVKYSDQLAQENWGGRGVCRGGQLKLETVYRTERLATVGPEMDEVINACTRIGDLMRANFVRAYAASFLIRQAKYDNALTLLEGRREEVENTRYKTLLALYDSLLARIYRETGNPALVQRYATSTIENSVKGEYTEPMVTGYRLLYVLARERGDMAAALEYHEKFSAADKGYLDELSARQLAYEKVKHESLANQMQIDALNRENEVLQLQQALDKKAVETSRLYIALLLMLVAFIIFFAYKTKRSQLHFMKLSQADGLTGIANRPHFIALAEAALATNRKNQHEVCVALCDLDHFKAINDQHGHAAGDTALRQVAAAIQAHLRTGDVFGRVGGEEFGILLPNCSLERARERCEQLRLALSDLAVRHESSDLAISASFGVESTSSCGYELRQLLANADVALYQAKHAGRNRVVVYDPSLSGFFTSMTSTGRFRSSRDRFGQDFTAPGNRTP